MTELFSRTLRLVFEWYLEDRTHATEQLSLQPFILGGITSLVKFALLVHRAVRLFGFKVLHRKTFETTDIEPHMLFVLLHTLQLPR